MTTQTARDAVLHWLVGDHQDAEVVLRSAMSPNEVTELTAALEELLALIRGRQPAPARAPQSESGEVCEKHGVCPYWAKESCVRDACGGLLLREGVTAPLSRSDEPTSPSQPAPKGTVLTLMEVSSAAHGAQLCALGFHSWMPWLTIRHPDEGPMGRVLRYETFCTRCKHGEQFDV